MDDVGGSDGVNTRGRRVVDEESCEYEIPSGVCIWCTIYSLHQYTIPRFL